MDGWKDPEWILHLFGNEQGETESDKLKAGALVFYPTWFNKVGFEVINPHSRKTKAGTNPIIYEVVPAGTQGCLHLLYAPLPGQIEYDEVNPGKVITQLVDGIEQLLQKYGISAKRTVGWGTAHIDNWKGFIKTENKAKKDEIKPIKKTFKSLQELGELLPESESKVLTMKDFKIQINEHFALNGGTR